MRKFFNIIVSLALSMILIFSLSSCAAKNTECEECEQEFFNGYASGREEVFLGIFNSSESFTTLFDGDVWDTEHFSLNLHDHIYGEDPFISYDITLKNTTIGHCLKYEDFFFNIYATYGFTSNDKPYGEMILTRDNFIWDGILYYDGSADEYEKENKVSSECYLYNDIEYQNFLIIIATDGCLYCAVYYP